MIVKENWAHQGTIKKKVREFSKPSFREEPKVKVPSNKNHKRIRLKKSGNATLKTRDRKALNSV
jgi:hypothetical protein